jgi:hypothetical protein
VLSQELQTKILALTTTIGSSVELVLQWDIACQEEQESPHPYFSPWVATRGQNSSGKTILSLILTDDTTNFLAAVEEDPCLEKIDENLVFKTRFTSEPLYRDQSFFRSFNHEVGLAKINQFLQTRGLPPEPSVVAIVDSGIEISHFDLQTQIAKSRTGQQLIRNIVLNNEDVRDASYHGTHVAGLIGAAINNMGGAGAGGHWIKLMPVKVFTGETATLGDVVRGIRWAADQGAQVINLSISTEGNTSRSEILKEAISYAVSRGAFVVAAAGNESLQLRKNSVLPATLGAEIPGMVTVGSLDIQSGLKSNFSNFSNSFVQIFAPGSNRGQGLLSTVPLSYAPSGYAAQVRESGRTEPIEGTSMAAPLVAGVTAVVRVVLEAAGVPVAPAELETILLLGSRSDLRFMEFSREGRVLDLDHWVRFFETQAGKPLDRDPNWTLAGPVGVQILSPRKNYLQERAALVLDGAASPETSLFRRFQWYHNGKPLDGQRAASLSVPRFHRSQAGLYQLEVSSGANKVLSAPIEVYAEVCN